MHARTVVEDALVAHATRWGAVKLQQVRKRYELGLNVLLKAPEHVPHVVVATAAAATLVVHSDYAARAARLVDPWPRARLDFDEVADADFRLRCRSIVFVLRIVVVVTFNASVLGYVRRMGLSKSWIVVFVMFLESRRPSRVA